MLKHGQIYAPQEGLVDALFELAPGATVRHPAHQIALQEMVGAVRVSKEWVYRLEGVIEKFAPAWSLAPIAGALLTAGRRPDRCRDIRHRDW